MTKTTKIQNGKGEDVWGVLPHLQLYLKKERGKWLVFMTLSDVSLNGKFPFKKKKTALEFAERVMELDIPIDKNREEVKKIIDKGTEDPYLADLYEEVKAIAMEVMKGK